MLLNSAFDMEAPVFRPCHNGMQHTCKDTALMNMYSTHLAAVLPKKTCEDDFTLVNLQGSSISVFVR